MAKQGRQFKKMLSAMLAAAMAAPLLTVPVKAANPDDVQIIRPYITGMETVGTELTGKYTYYDVCGQHPEAATTFKWLRSDEKNGEYTEIEGQTGTTYTLTREDVGKYLKFEADPHLNGKAGESWMIGPVLSEDQYAEINNYFDNDNDYMANVNTIQAELNDRLADAVYFTVDSEDNGDHYAGSEYVYQNNVKKTFKEDEKPVVDGNTTYAPAEFFKAYLGAEVPADTASKEIGGRTYYELKAAVTAMGKQYWSGDESQSSVENFQMEHLGQGLIVISDTENIFDPAADRDLIDEACNLLYTLRATDEQMQWFRDAKYGMFMHWDPSSIRGVEISWDRAAFRPADIGSSYYNAIDPLYDTQYKEFNPTEYNPDEWMQLAKDAGMKYVVLTTKHHGSFSNFFTDYDNYSIKQAPYGQDIVKKYVDAAHRAGLKVGFYYSARDWYNPNYLTADHHRYLEYYFGQIQELLSNYGKIDIMWFDSIGTSSLNDWDPRTLLRRMKQLQPDLIVNNRYTAVLANYDRSPYDVNGDWYTPEHRLGGFDSSRPWESCMTVTEAPNGGWSYRPNGRIKTVEESVKYLINNVVNDGNLLYNIGPMPNGKLNEAHANVFRQVGEWLQPYEEAVYGTRGGPYINQQWGGSTYRVNEDHTETIYLHVSPLLKGYTVPGNTLQLAEPSNGQAYSKAVLVKDGKEAVLEKNEEGYLLTLPEGTTWDAWDTVIKLSADVKSTLTQIIQEAEKQLNVMDAEAVKNAKDKLSAAVAEAKKINDSSSDEDASAQLTSLNEALAAAKSASELYATILSAEAKLESVVVGTNPWECPKTLADALKNQIAAGKAVLASAESDKAAYDNVLGELKTAMDAMDAFMANLAVTFTPANNKVSAGQGIGMTTTYDELTIHYTLDGTDPTKDSPVYDGNKLVMSGKVLNIKAAAFDQSGARVGAVCGQTYLNPEGLTNEAAKDTAITESNRYNNDYPGWKACDNNANTRWATSDGTIAATLEVDFGGERTVNTAMIEEYVDEGETSRVSQFAIEYWDGTDWQAAYKGTSIGTSKAAENGDSAAKAVTFPTVMTTKMRLNITACMNPTIWEFSLYNVTDMVSLAADKTTLAPGTFTQLEVSGSYADGRPMETEKLTDITYHTDAENGIAIDENGLLTVSADVSENMTFNVWAEVPVNGQVMTTEKVTMHVNAANENLALHKPAESSSNWNGSLGAGNAVDGNLHTRWAAASNHSEYVLTVDLGKGTTFDQVCFNVYSDRGDPKNYDVYRSFKLQALRNGNWEDIYDSAENAPQITYPVYNGSEGYDGNVWVDSDGVVKSTDYVVKFAPVTADKIRLYSNDVAKEPSILEFEVYNTAAAETPDVVSVKELQPMTVKNGTTFEELALPKKAEVTFDDGSRAFLNIVWDEEAYDPNNAGTYTVEGELVLKDGVMTNTNHVKVSVDVTVEEAKSDYTVTVKNGTGSGSYAYNAKVTAKADAPAAEMKFAGWKADGEMISADPEYTFYVSNDIVLEAVYVKDDVVVEEITKALMTNMIVTKRPNENKYDVKFVGEIVVPDGYTIKDAGLVWSSKDGTTLAAGSKETGVKTTYIKKISNTNQFSVTIKGMPGGNFLRGKIFATVVKGGTPDTIYSAEKKAVTKK